jgi:photosystem II stability/assembly factor-like uncharacterized protein
MKRSVLFFGLIMLVNYSKAQSTWNQIPSGTNKKLNIVDFPSSTVGYIGGNDSILLKTTDGGETWSPINYSGVTFLPNGEHIVNLSFINELIGFMTVGPYTGAYKTIDGGVTWTNINNLTTCYNQGLYFFDENNGFMGGSGCFQGEMVYQLINGAWNQSTVNTPTWMAENRVVDFDFFNQNSGLGASTSGYILRTTDGGINWDTIPTPGVGQNQLTSVLIVSATLAYAGYQTTNSGFGLYLSIDGGLTWQEDFNSATFLYPNFLCLHQSSNGTIYSGGNSTSMLSGVIFESPNDPALWNYGIVSKSINSISSYNANTVFAVGDSGSIVTNHQFTLSVLDNSVDFQDAVTVFPNPANNSLQIHLKENLNPTALRMYASTGELSLEKAFTSSLDITELKPGVYFLEILMESALIRKKIIKT